MSDQQKTLKKVLSISHENLEIRMLIIRCVPPVIEKISGKTGSGRRAGLEEEEDGDDRSPQTGRYITGWRPDQPSMEGRGDGVV